MARPQRIEYAGAHYHVTKRGNARRGVFRRADDYELFLEKLGHAVGTFRVSLRAFCLMPNHVHLVALPPTHVLLVGARPCACPLARWRRLLGCGGQPHGAAPTQTRGSMCAPRTCGER